MHYFHKRLQISINCHERLYTSLLVAEVNLFYYILVSQADNWSLMHLEAINIITHSCFLVD